jgi:hypothetical protein
MQVVRHQYQKLCAARMLEVMKMEGLENKA